jgi:glucokinase
LVLQKTLPYCKTPKDLENITAKLLAEYAYEGDALAKEAYRISGEMLGRGLAFLIDVFNPEKIVIGSVFARAEDLLRPHMEKILKKEALPTSYAACAIVPAALGDSIGDYAALAVAK